MAFIDVDSNPGTDSGTGRKKRKTWRDTTSVNGLLRYLMQKHPDASREEIAADGLVKLKRMPDLVDEAGRHLIAEELNKLYRPRPSPEERRRRAEARKAAGEAEEAAAAILLESLTGSSLLNEMQDNGKRLIDCTTDEARLFAKKDDLRGKFKRALADRVGGEGTVVIGTRADVVAEAQEILVKQAGL
jgi:hypothetical protein